MKKKTLSEVLAGKAASITHIITDVDGVHTNRERGVSICDLAVENLPNGFAEVEGDVVRPLIPCDMHGNPEDDAVKYIAGEVGGDVFEIYQFYTPDGQAIIDLLNQNLEVWLISGRNSPCVRVRSKALGAKAELGVKEKFPWLKEQSWFDPNKTLFVSDNDIDADTLLAVKEAGGIAVSPSDGQKEAVAAAECITEATGGRGVVAEIGRALLYARGLRENP